MTEERATPTRSLSWIGGEPLGCRSWLRLVVEERVVVECQHGFAWLDPEAGTAKLAWPVPHTDVNVEGVSIGTRGRWSVVFRATRGSEQVVAVAVANRDRWIVPPRELAVIGERRLELYAVRMVDDAVDIVMSTDGDTLRSAPPELLRVTERGVERRTLRGCEHCMFEAALATPTGFRLLAEQATFTGDDRLVRRIVLVDETGVEPAPPELEWWIDSSPYGIDLTAHGVLGHRDDEIAEPDGRRGARPRAPAVGARPEFLSTTIVLANGVQRRDRIWERDRDMYAVVDDRTIVLVRESLGKWTAGPGLGHQHPVAYTVGMDYFTILQRKAGGYWWLSSTGEYAALTMDLRRADPRPLADLLRANDASVGGVWYALCGFPIAIALGLIFSVILRRDGERALRLAPVAVFCAFYAFMAWNALNTAFDKL